MTTNGLVIPVGSHEIAEGNSISLHSKELAFPMQKAVEGFQGVVQNLTKSNVDKTKNVKELKTNAIGLQNQLTEFSRLYTISKETGDSTAIIKSMGTEVNYLADNNDMSSLIFFMEGYIQHSELVELPELDELLDFTHTNVLIARILHRSQHKVGYPSMKKVLAPVIDDIDIVDLLDNALAIKDVIFMKSLAFNIVRYVIDENDTTGIKKADNPDDLFTQFEDMRNGVFLTEGPLIDLLEKIIDYDDDLYNDIIDRISTYNSVRARLNRSKSKNKQKNIDEYIFDASHLDLAISTAEDFKDVLNVEIENSNKPKKVKAQYGLGLVTNPDITDDSLLIEDYTDDSDIDDESNEDFIEYGHEEEWNDGDEDDDVNF